MKGYLKNPICSSSPLLFSVQFMKIYHGCRLQFVSRSRDFENFEITVVDKISLKIGDQFLCCSKLNHKIK